MMQIYMFIFRNRLLYNFKAEYPPSKAQHLHFNLKSKFTFFKAMLSKYYQFQNQETLLVYEIGKYLDSTCSKAKGIWILAREGVIIDDGKTTLFFDLVTLF